MEKAIQKKINAWLEGHYDELTKKEIRRLAAEDPEELHECFYRDLAFGTGGLRGLMGVGSNRINKYTISAATQGLADYLRRCFAGRPIAVAIAFDSRNHSARFAGITADVLAANQIKVYLFEALRPTPALSFALRHLACQSGVVITASHNPKEYNGYKVYWEDGGQITPPHDQNIIDCVKAIGSVEEIRFGGEAKYIEKIGTELDRAYLAELQKYSLSPEAARRRHDLKIVFTSIHGTGITLVPQALEAFGFDQVHVVEEQARPDGDFPTVVYPNPEEAEALRIGLEKAREIDADILLGTDPDADRVGIALQDPDGEFQLLDGNQTGALLFHYLITRREEKGLASDRDFVAKTVVTSGLIDRIAEKHGIDCIHTLTGFKYIAEKIREYGDSRNFVVGCEESYGYLVGDFVRDKDAVGAVALLCEMAAHAKDRGLRPFEQLIQIYRDYGFYREKLISITKKGQSGAKAIEEMMRRFRENPPAQIGGSALKAVHDYAIAQSTFFPQKTTAALAFDKSNVLQFLLEDGSLISARPSGTEPKIKFYISVCGTLDKVENYREVHRMLGGKIARIRTNLGLGD